MIKRLAIVPTNKIQTRKFGIKKGLLGTLVDRIDYNVEHTQIRVEEGLKHLTKAQSHQSKDRKMIVILVLAGLVIIFGVLLIVTKFR